VDQPSRAGEIAIDEHPARPELGELDGPAFRSPEQLDDQHGRGGAVGRPTGAELDVSADSLPEVAAPRADGPERVPSPAEDLDPVLDRLGEDGEDEQRDDGHGTSGRRARKLGRDVVHGLGRERWPTSG
jgi:hypothetical protein